MKRCPKCGKKGWFLILYNGLCEDCLDNTRSNAMQGKVYINKILTTRYNNLKDSYQFKFLEEFPGKIQEKIIPTAIADTPEEAQAIITISINSTIVGRYSDGSFAERADIKLLINDKEGNLLFNETFEGTPPADKIFKMSNEHAKTVTGSIPNKIVLSYMDNLLRRYRIHKDKH
jgi:hypothetical protein